MSTPSNPLGGGTKATEIENIAAIIDYIILLLLKRISGFRDRVLYTPLQGGDFNHMPKEKYKRAFVCLYSERGVGKKEANDANYTGWGGLNILMAGVSDRK